jgi:hypothetical protein
MKASKFTDAQKAFVIKQGEEATPVAEVCRKAGISQATYFNWKKKYARGCCQPRCGGCVSSRRRMGGSNESWPT